MSAPRVSPNAAVIDMRLRARDAAAEASLSSRLRTMDRMGFLRPAIGLALLACGAIGTTLWTWDRVARQNHDACEFARHAIYKRMAHPIWNREKSTCEVDRKDYETFGRLTVSGTMLAPNHWWYGVARPYRVYIRMERGSFVEEGVGYDDYVRDRWGH